MIESAALSLAHAGEPALSIAEAADELGVAPARIRSLLASGALQALPGDGGQVSAEQVADLVGRGTVRALDVAAVEGALDRALRRRLPGLLDAGLEYALEPLSGEVALALADVEITTAHLGAAERRAELAEDALDDARAQVHALRKQVAQLEEQLDVLAARPVGLFRRRRPSGYANG